MLKFQFNGKKMKPFLGPSHLLANLETKLGKDVQYMKETKSPRTPSFGIIGLLMTMRKLQQRRKCNTSLSKVFISIANTIRELSKRLDDTNMSANKAMH